MAIMRMKTMYRAHLDPVPSFLYQPGLLGLHKFLSFLYDTMPGYDAPTKADGKYTNHEYFPSNVNRFVRNVPEQNYLFRFLFAGQSPHQLMVAYQQTIVWINMVQRQRRFVQNVQPGVCDLQFQIKHLDPASLSQSVYGTQNDLDLHIFQHFHSLFHLHS